MRSLLVNRMHVQRTPMEMIDVYSKISYIEKLKVNIVDFFNDFEKAYSCLSLAYDLEKLEMSNQQRATVF